MRGKFSKQSDGFALVVVLVVMGVVLLLAVGLLALMGTERKTARSFVDTKRADWVARAGLEEVRGLLGREAANDEYLVVAGDGHENGGRRMPEHLYLARGYHEGDSVEYEVWPLFSAVEDRTETERLNDVPEAEWWVGDASFGMETEPWLEPSEVAWVALTDGKGRVVGRYAYVVEDMQAKLEARHAHGDKREGWPWLVPGKNDESEVHLAFAALESDQGEAHGRADLDERLAGSREYLRSPESVLGAMGFEGGITRNEEGRLDDPLADVVERRVLAMTRPYEERPMVPMSEGLARSVWGEPKRNLNEMLGKDRAQAVDEMAGWIDEALPTFRERGGGYSGDYLRALAANMMDYADEDSAATMGSGYRGIDAYPLISEVFLRIDYGGLELGEERKYLLWEFKVYVELWNMTNQTVAGDFQVSYENGLRMDGIGVLPQSRRFDDRNLMDDPEQTTHQLDWENERYWSRPRAISLAPDEYGIYEAVTVKHRIDVGPRSGPGSEFIEGFSLFESEGAAGISQRWNGQEVNRVAKLIRSAENLEFWAIRPKVTAEAAVPGLSYGSSGSFINNLGDPRAVHDLRAMAVAENSYPRNASPGRRNIRRGTIYRADVATKPKIYGRVLPAEWPDGGHNSPVGDWETGWSRTILPTSDRMRGELPALHAAQAPQVLSNRGWYESVTELGRIYDPIMWRPAYEDLDGEPGSGARDTASLLGRWPRFPEARNRWPLVTSMSVPSEVFGGGNTLRIGRDEHPKFNRADWHASRMLDLFHVGRVDGGDRLEREGPVAWIDGRVNLNTASEEVVRALLAGKLVSDPLIGRRISREHDPAPLMAPPTEREDVVPFLQYGDAEGMARAVVEGRPYASAYDLAKLKDVSGRTVWGNAERFEQGEDMQWSDAAAEELFARVWNTSTVRSRNFRVWVIGQLIAPHDQADDGWRDDPVVLAESRKVFSLFANPGERDESGAIREESFDVEVLYENDF